jgi:hypothetical protein
MATTTTNFGWDIPQSTDLVKDGATAIAALGQDIDTALVDLKGGTTGQVLAKATNTDLDFTWVAQDDSNAIQNAIVDAKGDLIAATAADTPARLAVGTNGQVLTADSSAATGLAWTSPGGSNFVKISTTSMSSVSSQSVNNCFSSTYSSYLIVFIGSMTTGSYLHFKLRASGTNSSTDYRFYIQRQFSTNSTQTYASNSGTEFEIATGGVNPTDFRIVMDVIDPFTATPTGLISQSANKRSTTDVMTTQANGAHIASTSYDGFSIIPDAGTITGSIVVYGRTA